ncbi:hypothetical protein KBD18_01825 [Patescibacteria group bacterium]|nr:hypothetical protein [Patescibacteria group bacterium]
MGKTPSKTSVGLLLSEDEDGTADGVLIARVDGACDVYVFGSEAAGMAALEKLPWMDDDARAEAKRWIGSLAYRRDAVNADYWHIDGKEAALILCGADNHANNAAWSSDDNPFVGPIEVDGYSEAVVHTCFLPYEPDTAGIVGAFDGHKDVLCLCYSREQMESALGAFYAMIPEKEVTAFHLALLRCTLPQTTSRPQIRLTGMVANTIGNLLEDGAGGETLADETPRPTWHTNLKSPAQC